MDKGPKLNALCIVIVVFNDASAREDWRSHVVEVVELESKARCQVRIACAVKVMSNQCNQTRDPQSIAFHNDTI
jgi:hypothetical protein